MSPISIPGKVTLAKEFTAQSFMYLNPDTFGLWSPSQISTELWLDGSDSSTITETSGAISQWNDKSGNARHASQSNASYRPVVSAATFSAIPSVYFGVPLKFFEISSFGSGTHSWFFAFVSDGATTSFVGDPSLTTYIPIATLGSTNTNILRLNNVNDPSGAYQIYGGESSQSVANRGDAYTELNRANGNICGYINLPVITGTIRLGLASSATSFLPRGYMGEAIVLSGTPSSDTIQKVQGYLAHKWGLLSTLPSNHPYKTGAPML